MKTDTHRRGFLPLDALIAGNLAPSEPFKFMRPLASTFSQIYLQYVFAVDDVKT